MSGSTGLAWETAPRTVSTPLRRIRSRSVEAASVLFAMVALAVATAPVVIEQSTDGAAPRSASAEASSSAVAPRGGESMFAGYMGAPYTYPSDVTIRKTGRHDFTAREVPWVGKPFTNPVYYGARILHWFGSGRIGTMLDFTHSKTIADLDKEVNFTGTLNGAPAPERAALRSIFDHLEASHGHNMLTLNGLFRLPSLGARLHPYVGIGAGVALPHSEVRFESNPARTYEYQYAGPVGQALIGIELRTPRVSYFIEYKFTFARYLMPLSERDGSILFIDLWNQVRDWLSGTEPPGGRLTTDLASHQIIGGIGIRTAPAVAAP